jgi:hypothetical protein
LDIAEVAHGYATEKELDRLIERRAQKGETTQDEKEEAWKLSLAAHREREREQNRWEWVRFFDRMAEAHRELSQDYERRAEALCEDKESNGATA